MTLDKIVTFDEITIACGADYNWVQSNDLVLIDNAAGVVPKSVKTLFLNGEVIAQTSTKAYAVILLVTNKDATIPTFSGNDAAFASAMTSYKDNIWATHFGYAVFGDFENAAKVSIEPSTGRTLEPGQKLVAVCLARCATGTSAGNLSALFDWNIWFTYG